MNHWDSASDKSSCRKYRYESFQDFPCEYFAEWRDKYEDHPNAGYLFEIYDYVIDVQGNDPSGEPEVADNRLITSVFVCDSCYAARTKANEA